nr:autotransporter outer membrane beta-barrel domain-containing protein [Elusimicrobiaceae bacterium]
AIVNGTVVSSGGSEYVSSGAIVNDTILSSGGNQYVLSGGTTNRTVINSSGYQSVYLGGLANSTIINSGGLQDLAGVASDTVVSGGGTQNVNSGGSAMHTTLYASAIQNLATGGSAVSAAISGGTQNVSSNAHASSAIITDNGIQNISSGGYAYDTNISSGTQNVSGGALVLRAVVKENGTQNILAGGSALDTAISGGVQNVSSGAAANSTWMNFDATQNVYGQVSSVDLYGGTQNIHSGGIASRTLVHTSSAVQNILAGGSAIRTSVFAGGVQNISSGATANSALVNGTQNVYGTDNNGTISGGIQNIYEGGTANNTLVRDNGMQNVSSGASALSATISGGRQTVLEGGYASHTVAENNGIQQISGTAVDNTINSGLQTVGNGGVATSNYISTHGTQSVDDGGVANDTTVYRGTQHILAGGVASNVTLAQSAIQNVFGTANDVLVNSGSIQNIQAGGIVNNATVKNSGMQNINSNGTANNTVISAGGQQGVYGIANSTTINSSGFQAIYSGGVANTVNNDGVVSLYSGGVLNNGYTGNGELNIYGNNTISGTTNIGSGLIFMGLDNPSTITIENLSANSATIDMGVKWEDQTADQLHITSSYDGNATLKLRSKPFSVATATSGTGIKLVDIENSDAVNGTFELLNGQWDEGGYVYNLFQDLGDPDYYLRSTGEYTNTFKTMANVPMLNAVVAKTGMNSLNKRMGDLRNMQNPNNKAGIWLRSYYKNMTVDDLAKTDMSLFGVEAGYDWLFRADEPTKLYAGVMVGYMQANSIKTKNSSGDNNDGKGDAPSIGLYATLANEEGWFIDLAARNFWSKIENTTHTSSDTYLKFDSNRNLFTLSAEAGKTYTNDNGLRLEPKAELSYMHAGAESTSVTGGMSDLEYDAENYLAGKLAVMFSYPIEMSNQLLIEPLAELAYNHEFAGKGKVRYGGAETETSLSGGSFEIDAGLSMQLADNLYWHALASYEAGSKLSGWGLNAGIRLGFGGSSNTKKKVNNKVKSKVKTKSKYASKSRMQAEYDNMDDYDDLYQIQYGNKTNKKTDKKLNKKLSKKKKQVKKRSDYSSVYEYYRDLVK